MNYPRLWNEVLQGNTEQKWATFENILDDQISKHVLLKQIVEHNRDR